MSLPEEVYDIILARLEGTITTGEEKCLREWLESDTQHQKIYQELCTLWYSGRWGEQRKMISRPKGWIQIMHKRNTGRRRRIMFRSFGIAASLLLAIGLFQFREIRKETNPDLHQTSEKNQITLVLSSGEQIYLDQEDRNMIREESALIQLDSALLEYQEGEDGYSGEELFNELIIPHGGEFRLHLADGSSVILNSGSKLRYPVRFTGTSRIVYLEGEACFNVAKDTGKPFIVRTDKADVRVLGTLFNVSAYQEDENTEITLAKGSVQVEAGSQPALLVPNRQLVLNNKTGKSEIREVDASLYLAWTTGVLQFDALPLEQLMVKLNRWFDVDYEFKSEQLRKVHFTGAFRRYDDISYILEVIGAITEVSFRIEKNKIIIE